MDIQELRSGEVVVVAPRGRVDSTTSGDLEQRLLQLVGGGERRLVLDLAGVEYISSAGLRVLLVVARRMKAAPGDLVLCALTPPVRQVFDLAGFLPLFATEDTRAAALSRLAPPR